ncbi:MAG: SRPBCC family protein [Oculatellaceae cyanobacterium Prado106]|jgi:uncharacterized membrane protein|nr:SRPBCC family protein [Oculatellaceae cyanobacterium Prado106]
MTSAPQRSVKTTDFEQSITVHAPADRIFEYLSDVQNVPEYLPTVTHAERQSGEHIRTQGHAGNHEYDSDGHFRIDHQQHRLEWGSDGENDYSGWLEVNGSGDQSEVKVHIHYAPPAEMQQDMAEQSPQHSFESAMNEGIGKTLESIKRICEGTGGKQEISPNQ